HFTSSTINLHYLRLHIYGIIRGFHLCVHSFPTRRSSDLVGGASRTLPSRTSRPFRASQHLHPVSPARAGVAAGTRRCWQATRPTRPPHALGASTAPSLRQPTSR